MRKALLIFTLVLVFTLFLSACSTSDTKGNPTSTAMEQGGTSTLPATPNTGAATNTVSPTESTGTPSSGAATATPTSASSSIGTATAEPTGIGTVASTPTTSAGGSGSTPTATQSSSGSTGGSTGGTGLIGIPQTGSNGFVGLAAMMNWRVVGADGKEIGTVQDYVLNMCEAHILYLVVSPAAGVTAQGGQQILIPFEAVLVELNQGSKVDVQQGVFTLKQNASDLNGVPGVNIASVNMQNPDWAQKVDNYWKGNYRLSLTAGCNVPVSGAQTTPAAGTPGANTPVAEATTSGTLVAETPAAGSQATATPAAGSAGQGTGTGTATPTAQDGRSSRQTIYRIALASKILTANLQEGTGRQLGKVQDIAIVPQSGRTQYIVVDLSQSGQGASRMVALPPGAVNVSYENGGSQPVLILLVQTSVLQSAPVFDKSKTTTDNNWFNFWSGYIPMTREQLP